MPTLPLNVAFLTLELSPAGGYPDGCNAHIFPDGLFRADDGRPGTLTAGVCMDWRMSAEIAAPLIAQVAAKDVLYDWEHNSIWGDSEAAGWIDRLVYVSGRGLFAHVEWVPDAADAIAQKKYCYSSPYFEFDPATGGPTKLISVALTNVPALEDLGGVGLRRQAMLRQQEGSMADGDVRQQVVALTVERDGLKAALTAMTEERDALSVKVVVLESEKAAVALAKEKQDKADLIAAALTGGKLLPAQKGWAEKQSLAALRELIGVTPPVLDEERQTGGSGGVALTAEEVAMCSKMGVSHDDFRAAKALNSKE